VTRRLQVRLRVSDSEERKCESFKPSSTPKSPTLSPTPSVTSSSDPCESSARRHWRGPKSEVVSDEVSLPKQRTEGRTMTMRESRRRKMGRFAGVTIGSMASSNRLAAATSEPSTSSSTSSYPRHVSG
jgi:hypothetical protein